MKGLYISLLCICSYAVGIEESTKDYISVTNLTQNTPIYGAIYVHKKGERPVRISLVHYIGPNGAEVPNIVRPPLSALQKIALTDRDFYFSNDHNDLAKELTSKNEFRKKGQYFNVGEVRGKEFAIAPATNGTPDVMGRTLMGGPKEYVERKLDESRKSAFQSGALASPSEVPL